MFKLAVICGGPSLERGISLNSARSVMDHLSSREVEIIPLYVDMNKNFYAISCGQLYSNTPSDFDFKLAQTATRLDADALAALFKQIDLAFPVIHGPFGEDGELQKLLESHQVPYVGSDAASCQAFFHKYRAPQILQKHGFKIIPSLHLMQGQSFQEDLIKAFFAQHQLQEVIVKPVNGGSSIGVTKACSPLDAFRAVCNLYDQRLFKEAVIEPLLKGIEFTVLVLESDLNEPVPLIPTEIEIKQGELLDYRMKYLPTNQVAYHTPPRFSEAITAQIRSQARAIFSLFKMRDFVRLDGWIMEDQTIYFTDYNPISGLEQNSYLFRQASIVGMTHREVLHQVVGHACQRYGIQFPSLTSQGDIAEKKKVFVLLGGSNAERQVSLMSGTNVWLKLLRSDTLYPIPFLYDAEGYIWQLPYSYALNHTVEEIYQNCLTAGQQTLEIREMIAEIQTAIFTSSSRILVSREGADVAFCDEGIALAIAEEKNVADDLLAGDRKLFEEVNTAVQTQLHLSNRSSTVPLKASLDEFTARAKQEDAFIFIAMHGGVGENGVLQRHFEREGLCFNGSGAASSELCMDKYRTGEVIHQLGDPDLLTLPKKLLDLPQIGSLNRQVIHQYWDQLQEELHSGSLLVKPRADGCSAGIVVLYGPEDLATYCDLVSQQVDSIPAGLFGNQTGIVEMPKSNGEPIGFMVEPYIETDTISIVEHSLRLLPKSGWIELTVGVLEENGNYHVLNPSITVAEGAVLSLEEKFQGGTGVNLTPPPAEIISSAATAKIKRLLEKAARALAIQNYCRIDIFFNIHSEKVIIIEANSLPGLTPSTVIYHQGLAEEVPIPPTALLEKFVMAKLTAFV